MARRGNPVGKCFVIGYCSVACDIALEVANTEFCLLRLTGETATLRQQLGVRTCVFQLNILDCGCVGVVTLSRCIFVQLSLVIHKDR